MGHATTIEALKTLGSISSDDPRRRSLMCVCERAMPVDENSFDTANWRLRQP